MHLVSHLNTSLLSRMLGPPHGEEQGKDMSSQEGQGGGPVSKRVWQSHSWEAGDRRGIRGEAHVEEPLPTEWVQTSTVRWFSIFCLTKFHE